MPAPECDFEGNYSAVQSWRALFPRLETFRMHSQGWRTNALPTLCSAFLLSILNQGIGNVHPQSVLPYQQRLRKPSVYRPDFGGNWRR